MNEELFKKIALDSGFYINESKVQINHPHVDEILKKFLTTIVVDCARIANENYSKGYSPVPVGGFILHRYGVKDPNYKEVIKTIENLY